MNFSEACKEGNLLQVKKLTPTITDGATGLHFCVALKEPNVDCMKYLLNIGIPINAENRFGNTALHWACGYAICLYNIKFLIKSGADINIKNSDDETPLKRCFSGTPWSDEKLSLVDLLIESGAVCFEPEKRMMTPTNRSYKESEKIIYKRFKEQQLEYLQMLNEISKSVCLGAEVSYYICSMLDTGLSEIQILRIVLGE